VDDSAGAEPVTAQLASAILGTLLLATAAIASVTYRGSAATFILFTACFVALGALAVPRPRLYVFTFLAAFLLLGFWFKVMFHAILRPEFVEPVGAFSDAAAQWDSALLVASAGAAGLIAARLAHLWWARGRAFGQVPAALVPQWFHRWSGPVWTLTAVLVVAVNAANLYFAFYQVGVKPKLLLPLRGHVLLGWLVNVGFAIWVAALVWWDHGRGRDLGRRLVAPIGEALLSATSSFSRLTFVVRALSWVLAFHERSDLRNAIKRRSRYLLLGTAAVLFVLSVLVVFGLRVYQYYGYSVGAGTEPFAGHVQRTIVKQVPLLLLHRWVGLEGVLAVGSAETRSSALLGEALRESPALAGQSVFQRLAKTRYLSENPEQFVFLGNAGPVAVLWLSGSLEIVLLGMAGIGVLLFATEEAARRWTGNPLLLAVAGAALANVVSQTTFFYLTFIFLLQLWLAMAFIGGLQRLNLGKT
jgi:hypothetical protein